MDFKEQIRQLGEKVTKLRDQINTEEATKNAFIMPFIQLLGYDIFNPTEVVPEFIADYGAKNIEKVDYAIFRDNNPVLIIECKYHQEPLDKHYAQLHKYFHMTTSRFGLLTNGVQFNFYTDLKESNKLDDKPFLSFDITNMKDQAIKELSRFHKSGFDVNSILSNASELRYSNDVKAVINSELYNPSPEFVKFFVKKVYDGPATEKVMNQFTDIVKRTFENTFNDIVSDRLMQAINQTKSPSPEPSQEAKQTVEDEKKIITTEEELNGYYIVKSILRDKVEHSRIAHRDFTNYFNILLDNSIQKPICRLWFNGAKKFITLFDENKKENKIEITQLDDIYNYASQLIGTCVNYDNPKKVEEPITENNIL